MNYANFLILILLILSAVAAMSIRSLMATVILFGVFSFGAAAYYVSAGALDVAFTEAVIGAVISTVFFIMALYQIYTRPSPSYFSETNKNKLKKKRLSKKRLGSV